MKDFLFNNPIHTQNKTDAGFWQQAELERVWLDIERNREDQFYVAKAPLKFSQQAMDWVGQIKPWDSCQFVCLHLLHVEVKV